MSSYIVHLGTKTIMRMEECVVVVDFGKYNEESILQRAVSRPSLVEFPDELQDLVDRYLT